MYLLFSCGFASDDIFENMNACNIPLASEKFANIQKGYIFDRERFLELKKNKVWIFLHFILFNGFDYVLKVSKNLTVKH